jgi:ribosomal protein S6
MADPTQTSERGDWLCPCSGCSKSIAAERKQLIEILLLKKAEYWGLRQLAYRINKNTKAHYYFWQISSNKKLTID